MTETTPPPPDDLAAFPALLRLLAEACGAEAALDFAERLGGVRFYVPEKLEGSRLEEEAGAAVASCLIGHFPGEYVTIPQIGDRLRAARRRAYVARRPEATLAELARALSMSRSGVQLIRKGLRLQSDAT